MSNEQQQYVVVNNQRNGLIQECDIFFYTKKIELAKKFDSVQDAERFIEKHRLNHTLNRVVPLDQVPKFL